VLSEHTIIDDIHVCDFAAARRRHLCKQTCCTDESASLNVNPHDCGERATAHEAPFNSVTIGCHAAQAIN
jgi:hypothetical protein